MPVDHVHTAVQLGAESGSVLLQYGAVGAMLLLFLAVFLYLFYRLFNHMLQTWTTQWKEIAKFMEAQTNALNGTREAIYTSQKEIIYELRSNRDITQPHIVSPPRLR